MNPRISALLAKTKTVCFGRFLIDVPDETQVVWGRALVPWEVTVYPGEASKQAEMALAREHQLQADIRFPASKKLPMHIETIDGPLPGQRNVISQRDFDTTGDFRIESFLRLTEDLVVVTDFADEKTMAGTVARLNKMTTRLRSLSVGETPSDAGQCIENAFLPDDSSGSDSDIGVEHIRVGFRLKEFPDTHLSIYVAPANADETLRWGLEHQLKRTEEDARKNGQPNPYEKLTTFRRSKRSIHDWTTGFEYLTRSPKDEQVQSYHTFWMKFTGEAKNPLKPFAEIMLQTGVKDGTAGLTVPSLTDEEVIAVWDKITSSIRPRPTGTKLGANGLPIKAAIGERATTGRKCPQAGWWECVDDLPLAEARGRFFCEGDAMPGVQVWGKPTYWERLRGERPQRRVPTEWRLTAYEGPPKTPTTPLEAQHEPSQDPGAAA